jgi:four helix bundle protein
MQFWQRARIIVNKIYGITSDENFRSDYALKNQAKRAAISVMLNIGEGFGRQTNKEFRNFLFYSNGSLVEVQCALYIALDRKYISEKKFEEIYQQCTEISKMISSLIKYLKPN